MRRLRELRVGLPLPVLVATEDDRLIANKSPPGLGWPSAWWRQVARHGGLGHAEAEHARLATDPRRTLKKVLTTIRATNREIPSGRYPRRLPGFSLFRLSVVDFGALSTNLSAVERVH